MGAAAGLEEGTAQDGRSESTLVAASSAGTAVVAGRTAAELAAQRRTKRMSLTHVIPNAASVRRRVCAEWGPKNRPHHEPWLLAVGAALKLIGVGCAYSSNTRG